jgi:hypothetical protein
VAEAHLKHLREHNQTEYLEQALAYLREIGMIPVLPDPLRTETADQHAGCPGARSMHFASVPAAEAPAGTEARPSRLTHWPIQLHLISPQAPHFHGTDLLLAADCVAFSLGGFHENHLKGKTLAIACPKLDSSQEIYLEKLTRLIEDAQVKSITVTIMQVPCCGGLLQLARRAAAQAKRQVPVNYVIVGLRGEIIEQGAA